MKTTRSHILIAAAMVFSLSVMAQDASSKIEKKQKDIRTMARDTLERLYEADPKAKSAVEGASGYAVFSNQRVFNSFVNSGWQFGGQATAAVKNGDKGASMEGAVSVSDGVWMYQLTDKGIALEITAKSTKYYKDDDLN